MIALRQQFRSGIGSDRLQALRGDRVQTKVTMTQASETNSHSAIAEPEEKDDPGFSSPPPYHSEFDYDIAIVGGGIVGLTLACALKGSGLRIAIIEAQTQSQAAAKGQAYALQLISSQILQEIGVWSEIAPWVQPFERVRMSDGNYPHIVEFQSQDLNADVLGHVAEHRVLLTALQTFLNDCPEVHWFCPAQVINSRDHESGVIVDLISLLGSTAADSSPTSIRVRLLVGADGSQSRIRQQAGIGTQGWNYWQSCIVVTVATEKPHHNIAYEKFWPSGPFAILPLPGNHCRIVWTAPHAEATAIAALDDPLFLEKLSHCFGSEMGKLTLTSQRYIFSPCLMQSRDYISARRALVGDAAHTCHPVGGQGLNLGIRDAAALAELLRSAQHQGVDIGIPQVLKPYQDWRRTENWATLGLTDLIDRIFSNHWLPVVVSRRLGLRVMQALPPVKIVSLKFMAGLLGRIPRLGESKSSQYPRSLDRARATQKPF
jgi:2-octaprenyl-6-methoxyphenol hydroxylase